MATESGTVAAQHELDAARGRAADEQAALNAAAGRRAVALAEVLAAASAVPEAMLDVEVARVELSSAERRSSVARRALVAEVACTLGVSEHVAQGLLADAEVLASKVTATLDALCTGRISYQHASKLADTVADLPAAAAAQVERAVLGRAPDLTAARFGALARAARDRLHPVPAEVRHEAAALKAGVWADDGKDGMSWLTAQLPTPVAHAAFDRLTRTATQVKSAGDPRGIGQLRAATLSALLLDTGAATTSPTTTRPTAGGSPGSGSGDGEFRDDAPGPPGSAVPRAERRGPPDPLASLARSVRPVLHVTVPITTLTGTSETPGTLNGVLPVDAETARHLAARARTLRRVLTDPVTGAMLTVDRRSYVVPADLRAFLTQRDVTCRFPGCRVPVPRCDVDHTLAWAEGGTTDAGNLAHLCRAHHTLKHESRWTVEQLTGGVLAWTSPRGRTTLTMPGVADHTLDQLDTWATEARALIAETSPPTQATQPVPPTPPTPPTPPAPPAPPTPPAPPAPPTDDSPGPAAHLAGSRDDTDPPF